MYIDRIFTHGHKVLFINLKLFFFPQYIFVFCAFLKIRIEKQKLKYNLQLCDNYLKK